MQRGDLAGVRLYGGENVVRRVWEDLGKAVLLCSQEAYDRASKTGEEPVWVGFPRHDVQPISRTDAA